MSAGLGSARATRVSQLAGPSLTLGELRSWAERTMEEMPPETVVNVTGGRGDPREGPWFVISVTHTAGGG